MLKNKKAESNTLTILLIILIILVLMVIIWNLVMGLLKKNVEITDIKVSMIGKKIDINDVTSDNFNYPDKVNLSLTRGPDNAILINRTEYRKFADIVFVIDSTSSMQDEIMSIYNISLEFINLLSQNKINFTIGLVDFKDYNYSGPEGARDDYTSYVHKFSNNQYLTADVDEFKNLLITINNSIKNGSGNNKPESHLEALENGTKTINFRNIEGAPINISKRFVILLSDSPPHSTDCYCTMNNSLPRDYECYGSDSNVYLSDSSSPGENIIASSKNPFYPIDGKPRYVEWRKWQGQNDIDSNIIAWSDRRAFDVPLSSNYHIYICNLNTKPLLTSITEWCDKDPGVNGVKIISKAGYFNYYPRIDNDIVVWESSNSSINGNYNIYLYNITDNSVHLVTIDRNLPTPLITSPGPGQTTTLIYTSFIDKLPVISGNITVWQDYMLNQNWEIIMCDFSNKPESASFSSWCTDESKGLRNVTMNINRQMYPEVSGNIIAWQDNRTGTYKIYLCDLSTKPQLETVTSWCNDLLKGLSPLTDYSSNQFGAKISDNKIVWQDFHYGNYEILYCDLSLRGATPISTWCGGPGQERITNNANTQDSPEISNNRITWRDSRNAYFDVYSCNIDNKPPFETISSWCTGAGLTRVTNSNQHHYTPRIWNDYTVWNSNSNTNGLGTTIYYRAKPDNITYFYSLFPRYNITFFYINRNTGLCKDDSLVNLTYYTGGSFYRYSDASQINNLVKNLGTEIIEVYKKEEYDHLKIVFYNATKVWVYDLYDLPNPLETKKYSLPLTDALYNHIVNITKIEVYMASLTKSGKEVIGPMLSEWNRKF